MLGKKAGRLEKMLEGQPVVYQMQGVADG